MSQKTGDKGLPGAAAGDGAKKYQHRARAPVVC